MTPPPTITAPGKLYVTWRLSGAHCHWVWERAVADAFRLEAPQAIRDSWVDVPIQVPDGACVASSVLDAVVQARVVDWNAARTAAGRPGVVTAVFDSAACVYREINETTYCSSEFTLSVNGAPWTVPDPDGVQDPAVLALTYEYSVAMP